MENTHMRHTTQERSTAPETVFRHPEPIPIVTPTLGLIPEHLIERNRKRQEESSSRRQNFDQPAEEHPDYIAQKFSELAEEIKERINESVKYFTHSSFEAESHDECDSPQRKFASHAEQIGELQRYLTACTRFLPDYKIKACTEVINELNKTLDESRQRVIPKKKFGFSARKPTKKLKIESNCEESEKSDPSKPIIVDKSTEQKNFNLSSTNSAFNLNRNLVNRNDEHILEERKNINKHDITLANLKNCFIELQGYPSSVRADNLSDCIVLLGPVSTSVYVENCQNTIFAIACQQLRCHNSNSCRIYLHVTCRAVIEDCKNMEFSNYNYKYANIYQDFLNAGLDENKNNYTDVADFNWLSSHAPSPNWSLIEPDKLVDFQSLRQDFEAKLKKTLS